MSPESPVLRPANRTGFALVIALGFLVLLTVLVIAFFTSVRTDYTTSKQYSSGAATKQLADSVVQVVMGQIKAATASTNPAGTALTWASQPGMIRTFDGAGNAGTNYKLYSSAAMTGSGTFVPATGTDYNTAPSAAPALWTDLNAPVTDATGKADFPIIDGNNLISLSKDAAGNTVPTPYLGYDAFNNATGAAGADGLPDVAGFSVDPGQVSSYNSTAPLSTTNTPVPLAVQWMYQLRDGTLIVPDAGSTTTATFNNAASQPTSANPIVGRIAFWTDDETSKVNINTAGQGTYWDTPHFYSSVLGSGTVTSTTASQFPDYAYATFQPAQFEFQRYPGHPAQVALNTIFPGMTYATAAGVTPRVVNGGSQGGTVTPQTATAINLASALRKALYASVDEYLYSGTPAPAATPRTVNQVPNAITKAQLEEAKFFITTGSRAPEVNLFGQPRVCMWPINSALASNPSSPYTTAYDRLIAFCATLHNAPTTGSTAATPYRYYFQRSNSQSPTSDYSGIADNQRLYKYLQTLTSSSVPGFGNSFLNKYPAPTGGSTPERDQILTEIFDYIRCTNLSDPNLGGMPPVGDWQKGAYQFANYQNEAAAMPQNSTLCGQVMPIQIGNTMGFGRYYTVKDVSMVVACLANGKAGTPTAPIGLLPADPDYFNQAIIRSSNDVSMQPALVGTPLQVGQLRMQLALFLNYFLPSQGQLKCGPDMLVGIAGLDQIQFNEAINIDGGGALFPSSSPPTPSGWVGKLMATNYAGYNPVDAVLKFRYPIMQHRSPLYARPQYVDAASSGRIIYPFVSRAFTVPTTTSKLTLARDATLTISLYQAKGAYDSADTALNSYYKPTVNATTYSAIIADPTNLIQTITVKFPATGSFPQPTLPTSPNIQGLATAQSPQAAWGFDGRIASPWSGTGSGQASALIAQAGSVCYDTVRTVTVLSGDARAVAATHVVANTAPILFGVDNAAAYTSATVPSYHYMLDNTPSLGCQSTGTLVPGIAASIGDNAFVPPGTATTAAGQTLPPSCLYGDWDGPNVRLGASSAPTTDSGAFINKPDEGDNANLNTGGTSYIPYYGFAQTTAQNLALYTPNRLMPSPGMLGSLPTGVLHNLPWRTLLFRPQLTHPEAAVSAAAPAYANGPPYTTIPDHLMMDLFWMPVVEPYAISEPFSTAGKINLNYQIAPFTYITRSTGLASLLANEKMAVRPVTLNLAGSSSNFRLSINPSDNSGTLAQVKALFATGNIFRSATQICDLDLVPFTDPAGVAQTWSSTWGTNFWAANANTGDNLRERPYTNLYARLTTKSNSYTVHFRVQSLQKIPATSVATWVENTDQILSEYRGSSLIERYVDPNDPSIVDFATNPGQNLDSFYKFRVVSTRQFAP